MAKRTAAGLEVADRRVFAWVVDWPGWCRAGKTDEEALDALAAYRDRFARVVTKAGLRLPANAGPPFDVVERVKGDTTTEFGAPGAVAEVDRRKVTPAVARRHVALLEAAWAVLDDVAAGSPAVLKKGPRGGGRDRDKMLAHVVDAEVSYARKLGVKARPPELRGEILAVLGAPSDGTPAVPKGWPPRYAARRFVWHVLDHAWEMEDKRP